MKGHLCRERHFQPKRAIFDANGNFANEGDFAKEGNVTEKRVFAKRRT